MSKLELFTLIKKLEDEAITVKEKTADLNEGKVRFITQEDIEQTNDLIKKNKALDFIVIYDNNKISMISLIFKESIFLIKKPGDFLEFFKSVLENKTIKKRTHDAKQLFYTLKKYQINPQNIVFDTMLAGYLLNPSAPSYDLEYLCAEHADMDFFNNRSVYDDIELYTIKKSKEFAKIIEPMCKQICRNGQESLLENIEIPLSSVLSNMEINGFEVDERGIKEYKNVLINKLEEIESQIYELVGYRFNIKSPNQLGDALFISLGLPHGKTTQRGYSTSAEILERIQSRHPVVPKVLDFRTISKIKSTYCDGMLRAVGENSRIHTKFSQTETKTGRLSSQEPNLQNIPVKTEIGKELRKFFCAREGCLLIDADYSQIELRILADISGDENMIDLFRNNKDIHTITAAKIFHLPESMVTKAMRNKAKVINFGIIYGMSSFSLAKEMKTTRKEANVYINNYFEYYSGIKNYVEKVLEFAKENGFVKTKFERVRYLPEIISKNFNIRSFGERAARNMPIQGTAADIIKIAMIRVQKRLEQEQLKSQLILQVHDELIIEAPEEEAKKVAKLLKQEMQEATSLKVPLVANIGTGKTWYEAKNEMQ
jgi:DNA polymerase-1